MKWITVLAVVSLVLVIVFESLFLVQQNVNQNKFAIQFSGLQQKASDLEKDKKTLANEKEELQNQKTNLQVEVSKQTQENGILSEKVAKLEGEIKVLNSQLDRQAKDLNEKITNVSKLQSENLSLKNRFMCKNQLNSVDFSSNDRVSDILTSYVRSNKNAEEPVSAHYWNLVWSDSKYSIHTVEVLSEKDNVNYIWKFTVYYRGEAKGNHKNGIFYNDHQCWLYLEN